MRWFPISAVLCCLLVLAPGASTSASPNAAAQEQSAPPPPAVAILAEIHASGSTRYNEAQLAEAAGLKLDAPVTPDQIQDAANHLAELGVFSRVNYHFENHEDRVTLNFELKDAPVVPVAFDNFPWFTDSELVSAIHEVAPLFGDTAPTDGVALDQMTAAIAKLVSGRGLPGTVEHRLIAQPSSDAMMMQFHLDGPEVMVESLELGDDLAKNSEKLRDRQHDLLKKPFSRFAVDVFEAEQILPLYLSEGNLRVHFGEPQARFLSSSDKAASSGISLTLPIEPGPVFHMGGVDWGGVNGVPIESLQAQLLLMPGALADGMTLAAQWQRVEAEYRHRGYLDAKVDPQPQFDNNSGTVSYHVAVTEGPQYHMGELVLTGLSPAAERALKAFWSVQRGGVFDGAFYDKVTDLLDKPNAAIFGAIPIHYDEFTHLLRTNPQTHAVDVLLDFK